MMTLGEADDAEAVPGSIKLSNSSESGVVKKKITFEPSFYYVNWYLYYSINIILVQRIIKSQEIFLFFIFL